MDASRLMYDFTQSYNNTLDTQDNILSLQNISSPMAGQTITGGMTGWAGQSLHDGAGCARLLVQNQQDKCTPGTSYNIFADGRGGSETTNGHRGRNRPGQGRRDVTGKRGYRSVLVTFHAPLCHI